MLQSTMQILSQTSTINLRMPSNNTLQDEAKESEKLSLQPTTSEDQVVMSACPPDAAKV